jgi:hypothetical protein
MQTTLRGARLNDRRFRQSGLTPDDADRFLPEVLAFVGEPRSNAEAEAWIDERLGETPKPGIWWAYRQYGPVVHHPTGGPWSFGPRPSYVAARPKRWSDTREAAVAHLVRRYLEGFGPASVADVAQFGLLTRPVARAGFAALEPELVRLEGPNGEELRDVRDGDLPAEDSPAPPRLLPMWDSMLLAYADRSRVIPAEYRKVVTRPNGDVLPTVLVDGYVAGVWRPLEDGVEATAFAPLSDDAWEALESEAAKLVAFLGGREMRIYTRYARWWDGLPAAQVRVLGK